MDFVYSASTQCNTWTELATMVVDGIESSYVHTSQYALLRVDKDGTANAP